MKELLIQMTFWLLTAILLGFIFGWILSRIKQQEKYKMEVESLNSILYDRNKSMEKLTNDYERVEALLNEKEHLLTALKANVNENIKSIEVEPLETEALLEEIEALKKIDINRKKELEEFEKVVMKAEEVLDSHERVVKELELKIERLKLENDEKIKAIELYKETIVDFENELKLYSAGKEDSEFVISKDQFLKIEEQLVEYQKEIELLKNKNRELTKNSFAVNKKREMNKKEVETQPLNVKNEEKKLEDGAVVNILKDTYKKITKS